MKFAHIGLMLIAVGVAGASCASHSHVPPKGLHDKAIAETLTPIHPGEWNRNAKQFIWAPSFSLQPPDGARSYRFIVTASDGTKHMFDAAQPSAPLTPVWKELPVGPTRLEVLALDRAGQPMTMLQSLTFHRAAAFNGPYGKPVLPYDQSARVALETLVHEPFVQSWRTTGKPDPSYPLYRYAAKVIGSLAAGCALHAQQTPRPADAEEAIAIGRAAADYLISISAPAGSPLEYFPPTYHAAKATERENDAWTMLMTPAEAAQGYLDLHDVTRDAKYFDAACRIADTYVKRQLPSGTWPLKVDNRTGEPIAEIELIPSEVIRFLDRLITQYGCERYKPACERAVRWMMENPVRTFDWKAQFDDAKVRGPYENLSKHEACQFATYLFMHGKNKTTAAEILRFAEDQFVVWEQPPKLKARSPELAAEHWITPCSCEQYAMFEPISGSSAWMIVAYVRAYEATGDRLYLLKAQSLANALTVAQELHGGRYPTRMVEHDLAYWLNSTVNTARALQMLATAR